MKNISIFCICLILICLPSLVTAQQLDNGGIFSAFPDQFQVTSMRWEATFKKYARYLFFTLGTIHFAVHFGFLVIEGLDFQKLVSQLVRFIMFFGFFYWLLDSGPWIASTIIDSCMKIGMEATRSGGSPADLLNKAFHAFDNANEAYSLFDPLMNFVIAFTGLAVMIVLTLAAINILIEYCTAWILIYAGFFVLGLGSTSWTKDIAITYFKTVMAQGLKLMTMILVLGICNSLIISAFGNMDAEALGGSELKQYAVILMSAVMLLILMVRIPSLISGLVGGIGGGGGGAIGFGAGVAAAGMAVKAAVAVKTGGASLAVKAAATTATSAAAGAVGSISAPKEDSGKSEQQNLLSSPGVGTSTGVKQT